MKKSDARILWNKDNNGKILDIFVAEFSEESNPRFLYEKFKCDYGNCNSSWTNANLVNILLRLGFRYGFANQTIAEKAFKELCKIDEFRSEIKQSIVLQDDEMEDLNSMGDWMMP